MYMGPKCGSTTDFFTGPSSSLITISLILLTLLPRLCFLYHEFHQHSTNSLFFFFSLTHSLSLLQSFNNSTTFPSFLPFSSPLPFFFKGDRV